MVYNLYLLVLFVKYFFKILESKKLKSDGGYDRREHNSMNNIEILFFIYI